jgi:hypothetical protein
MGRRGVLKRPSVVNGAVLAKTRASVVNRAVLTKTRASVVNRAVLAKKPRCADQEAGRPGRCRFAQEASGNRYVLAQKEGVWAVLPDSL